MEEGASNQVRRSTTMQRPRLLSIASSASPLLLRKVSRVAPLLTRGLTNKAGLLVAEDLVKAPSHVDLASLGLTLIPDFVTAEEETALLEEFLTPLKKSRYEDGHWDAVISRYRERQFPFDRLNPITQQVTMRAQALFPAQAAFFPPFSPPNSRFPAGACVGAALPYVHAIDLAKEGGEIRSHVDSVKFSGAVVCGLSLGSDAIMRLTEERDAGRGSDSNDSNGDAAHAHAHAVVIDIKLLRRSLYLITGKARYLWGHAVLGAKESAELGIKRERRLSIIMRDELASGKTTGTTAGAQY